LSSEAMPRFIERKPSSRMGNLAILGMIAESNALPHDMDRHLSRLLELQLIEPTGDGWQITQSGLALLAYERGKRDGASVDYDQVAGDVGSVRPSWLPRYSTRVALIGSVILAVWMRWG
jgi:hypothetical protein